MNSPQPSSLSCLIQELANKLNSLFQEFGLNSYGKGYLALDRFCQKHFQCNYSDFFNLLKMNESNPQALLNIIAGLLAVQVQISERQEVELTAHRLGSK